MPKIEVKQVEKVVEAPENIHHPQTVKVEEVSFFPETDGWKAQFAQVPNIEYQDRLVEVREVPNSVLHH